MAYPRKLPYNIDLKEMRKELQGYSKEALITLVQELRVDLSHSLYRNINTGGRSMTDIAQEMRIIELYHGNSFKPENGKTYWCYGSNGVTPLEFCNTTLKHLLLWKLEMLYVSEDEAAKYGRYQYLRLLNDFAGKCYWGDDDD